jgi:hypothetical protein
MFLIQKSFLETEFLFKYLLTMSEASGSENDKKVNESSMNQETVKVLLYESLNREKDLKRLLDEQLLVNDQLKLQLEMERKKFDFKGTNGIFKLKKLSLKAHEKLNLKNVFF